MSDRTIHLSDEEAEVTMAILDSWIGTWPRHAWTPTAIVVVEDIKAGNAPTPIRQIAEKFEEDFIWPRCGALGGPDTDECEQIVRAVLSAAAASTGGQHG